MATAAEKRREKKSKGQLERRKQKRERVDFVKTYAAPVSDVRLEEQEFRLSLLRRGRRAASIDHLVEAFDWRDEGTVVSVNLIPVLRGTLSLRTPEGKSGLRSPIRRGSLIRCEVLWAGRWEEVWRMRCGKPSVALDGTAGFELADDLALAAQSTGSFKFKKGKRSRKKGWLYHEIAKAVARQYRIPLGKLTKGTKYITMDEPHISPLEAIRQAVEQEATFSGRRLVISWGEDGLSVKPMRRNPFLYLFKNLILTASLTDKDNFQRATALIATGTTKKGKKDSKAEKKRKKVRVRIVSKAGVAKYGYIQREVTLPGNVEGRQEALEKGRRLLKKHLEPKPLIEEFEHPGIAWVRRGDAIRVSMPDWDYDVGPKGLGKDARFENRAQVQGIVFVISVSHAVSPGGYTMTLSLGFVDPMEPTKLRHEMEAAERARKRKKHGKKKAAT